MINFVMPLACASCLLVPLDASAATYDGFDQKSGSFAGARFQLPLGERSKDGPRVALTLSPTMSRISGGAMVQTQFGEGIALRFGRKPTLSFAGRPADEILGLNRNSLSGGGWIAVGAGVALVAAGIIVLQVADEAKDNSD